MDTVWKMCIICAYIKILLAVFSLRGGSRWISPSIAVFFLAILFPTKIDRYLSGTTCMCFEIVFILVPYLIVCALAQIWIGKPVITRSKSFPRFNPGELFVLNMYNYLTPKNRVTLTDGRNINITMSKRTIMHFFQSGPKAKQGRGLYFINLWSE